MKRRRFQSVIFEDDSGVPLAWFHQVDGVPSLTFGPSLGVMAFAAIEGEALEWFASGDFSKPPSGGRFMTAAERVPSGFEVGVGAPNLEGTFH